MLRFLLVLLLLWPAAPVFAGDKAVNVAVSIKPIHSLVSSLTRDVSEPDLIVSSAGSPHGYNLRPSEVRALNRAGLIVWVGPGLESFMTKSIRTLDQTHPVITLLTDLEDLQLLPARAAGDWSDPHLHDNHEGHADQIDPHLWLSPENAAIFSAAITDRLITIDPGNQRIYKKNRDALLRRLTELEQEMSRRLTPVQQGKYIVFHDAYQYFEKSFGLNPVAALAIDPDRRPGARRLSELRQVIRDHSVTCVFTEPQFEPRLIKILIEGTDVRIGSLDPLGADIPAGPDLYFSLMEQMAASVENCLAPER